MLLDISNIDSMYAAYTFFFHLHKVGTQMELQIQDLVESIKRDGIDEASKKSAQIIADAKDQAAEIVATAKKEATKIVEDAKKDIDVRDQSARASLQQAARDVELSLKNVISAQMDRLLQKAVHDSLDSKQLVDLIAKVVTSDGSDSSKKAIELSEPQFKSLASSLQAKLAAEVKAGLVIRPVVGVDTGFRIADKDGSGFYDFSAEEIASMMEPFLSPAIAQLVFVPASK